MSTQIIKFKQSLAASTWVIDHNLGVKPGYEAIIISANGDKVKAFPLSESFPTVNRLELTWSSPKSGFITIVNVA